MKIIIVLILCSFIFVSSAFADQVVLRNGRILEGNIISQDEEKNEVVLDVVLNGELIGMTMVIKTLEIKSIHRGDDHRHLVRREISPEEHLKNQQALQRAAEAAKNIDQVVSMRIQREVEHIRYVNQKQEERRRIQQELEHQKKMHHLELEAQKDLMDHAQNKGIKADVNIFRGL